MNQNQATADVGVIVADLFNTGEQLVKGLAWDCSAALLESLARSIEEGEEITPHKLRALAEAFRKEANK